VHWNQFGGHNVDNALAAIAAAHHAGVPVSQAITALGSFAGVRRRMELSGVAAGVQVYDDFAHHPTAIATTLEGLRRRIGKARLIAVLEPRSNTMRMGIHSQTLAPSLAGADLVFVHAPADLGWDASVITASLGERAVLTADIPALLQALLAAVRAGDHVLIMSNGGFGGLHGKLLAALAARHD
jgi:UDP-N-acetylmuramate: L-alanyl-gamma-D-glutamyl-meso-diaminopimelate ligase